MYGALDVSVSGMIVQRTRLQAIAANIANKDAILDSREQVNPYGRREVMIAPGNPAASTPEGRKMGVHVAAIHVNQSAIRWRYDPTNPLKETSGPHVDCVPTPDIDAVTEQTNAMEAQRAYEANLAAAETTKSMMAQALRLIA